MKLYDNKNDIKSLTRLPIENQNGGTKDTALEKYLFGDSDSHKSRKAR